jgi:O-antigen ligase
MAKLEKILFYIFLFLIPFQIRIFLFNPKSLLAAGLSEWNSIFVYLGDVVFAGVLALWAYRTNKSDRTNRTIFGGATSERRSHLIILIFLFIALISIFVSSATKISVFRWLKLVEFVAIFIYVYRTYKSDKSNRTCDVIIAAGLLQSILAIAQFIKQGSIGIKFIEAGVYNPSSPGVANFILNGEKIMRSYGGFPHPNLLAGFLLLAIFFLYAMWLKGTQGDLKGFKGIIRGILLLVLVFGLFLTFSRTAIVVFVVMSLIMMAIRIIRANIRMIRTQTIKLFGLFIISCMISIVILFPYLRARFFTISLQEQALDLRFFYNRIALSMIKEKPILGIGIGNFVNYSQNYETYLRAATKFSESAGDTRRMQEENKGVPEWVYQPVHNIYLLIASEIGILGLLVFLGFIGIILLRGIQGEFKGIQGEFKGIQGGFKGVQGDARGNIFLFLVICYLLLALFDHYFWTLQSGGIMFWLTIALADSC